MQTLIRWVSWPVQWNPFDHIGQMMVPMWMAFWSATDNLRLFTDLSTINFAFFFSLLIGIQSLKWFLHKHSLINCISGFWHKLYSQQMRNSFFYVCSIPKTAGNLNADQKSTILMAIHFYRTLYVLHLSSPLSLHLIPKMKTAPF